MTAKWPEVRLGDHIEFLTSGSRGWSQYVRETGAQFIRIQNVGRNELILQDMALVQPPSGAEAERTQVRTGDILISITADLGRTAVIPRGFGTGYINQHLALVRVRDFDPHFVSSFIGLGPGRQQLIKLDRGGVKSGLNFDDIRSITLPRPSISEQQQIVSILDKADAIRRMRRESVRVAEELLRSTFLEMFGDPVTNPKGWPSCPLSEIATFAGGGTPSRAVPQYFAGSICWATSKDMKADYLYDTEEHITEDAIENSSTKLFPPGTVLITVKSKILMNRLPVCIASVPICINQDLKAISLSNPMLARYLVRHLIIGQGTLLQLARGANTEGLTLDHLRNYRVMLPSEKLVLRFDAITRTIEQQYKFLQTAYTQSQSLFYSVLDRAFRGELTSSESVPRQLSIFPGESRRS